MTIKPITSQKSEDSSSKDQVRIFYHISSLKQTKTKIQLGVDDDATADKRRQCISRHPFAIPSQNSRRQFRHHLFGFHLLIFRFTSQMHSHCSRCFSSSRRVEKTNDDDNVLILECAARQETGNGSTGQLRRPTQSGHQPRNQQKVNKSLSD